MAKNAANEELMGMLHADVAHTLIDQLKGIEIRDDDGEVIGKTIDPRILSSAITFLNNNKVTMNPYVAEALSEIQQKLADRSKDRFTIVRKQAREDALKAAGMD